MANRSRFLRISALVVVVLLAGAYLAFATFFFNPFESDYDADVATLVPRDVDFFVAKARLRDDFAPFPELAVEPRLAATRGWQAFLQTPAGARFETERRAAVEQLRAELAQLRSIDVLAAFGGRDVAVAGYFRGNDLTATDWAVYGRANRLGKLAASALHFPKLIGLEKQGLQAVVEGEVVALSGGQLARGVFVTRVLDVVVIGTSRELVAKALDLDAHAGQESFGQGATYNDSIARARRGVLEDEIELFVDWRKLTETLQLSARWPNPQSENLGEALAGRLFQLGLVRSFAGVIGFDNGISIDADGELSSETMNATQKSVYRVRGRESDKIVRDLAQLPRADCQVLAHMEIGIGDLLRELFASLDDATRQLIEDALRGTGEYSGSGEFIDEMNSLFKGHVGLIVRANDYRSANPDKDPPHNDVPVPAIAVALWAADANAPKRILWLHNLISTNQGRLGLRGPDGAKGVYTNKTPNGYDIWEFWSHTFDGTGHLATVLDRDRFVISNSYAMLGDLYRLKERPTDVRLADRPDFTQLVSQSLPQSNLFVWVNPRELSKTLRTFAEYGSTDAVRGKIDWDRERALAEQAVLNESFPGKQRGRLTPEEQAEVDLLVNPRLDELERRLVSEQAPKLREDLERQIVMLEMCSAAVALVALDPKKFELSLRALVPLD